MLLMLPYIYLQKSIGRGFVPMIKENCLRERHFFCTFDSEKNIQTFIKRRVLSTCFASRHLHPDLFSNPEKCPNISLYWSKSGSVTNFDELLNAKYPNLKHQKIFMSKFFKKQRIGRQCFDGIDLRLLKDLILHKVTGVVQI